MRCHLYACVLLLAACDGEPAAPTTTRGPAAPIEDSGTTLSLAAAGESADLVTVRLDYRRRAEQEGPRAAELFVALSDNLAYDSSEAGAAALAAGKQLVVQDKGGGELRVLLFGTQSLDRLDSGALLSLDLRRTGAGPATVEVLDRQPLFAPAESNTGVLLPEPLTLDGS